MEIYITTTGKLDLSTLSLTQLMDGLDAVRSVESRVPGLARKYDNAVHEKLIEIASVHSR